MFQFAAPQYLQLFWAFPVLILLFAYAQWQTKRGEAQLGDKTLLRQLVPLRAPYRIYLKFFLLLCALGAGILVVARPQRYTELAAKGGAGIELITVMDVSQSMLAQDVLPSRLEKSKQLLHTLFQERKNDKIGLSVFAGEAYPLLPLTQDMNSAQLFLDRISCDMVSLQGTNLAAAIQLANKGFSDNKQVGKAIVLITDGENHESGAAEAAAEAAKQGCKVFVLGVGTAEGTTIPTAEGPLLDNSGALVQTSLNEQACEDLAKAGEGSYIHIDNTNTAQQNLMAELNKLQHSQGVSGKQRQAEELFHYPALAMLLLLVVEFLLFERKNPWLNSLRFFHRKQ